MAIKVRCPKCEQKIKYSRAPEGKQGKCPRCGAVVLTVEGDDDASASFGPAASENAVVPGANRGRPGDDTVEIAPLFPPPIPVVAPPPRQAEYQPPPIPPVPPPYPYPQPPPTPQYYAPPALPPPPPTPAQAWPAPAAGFGPGQWTPPPKPVGPIMPQRRAVGGVQHAAVVVGRIGRDGRVVEPTSFTWKAFATIVLYCFFWVPGICANILFLVEAKSTQRRSGVEPEGVGCLWAMLIVMLILPLAVLALFMGGAFASFWSSDTKAMKHRSEYESR